jgi:hypothetical protein
MRRWTFDTTQPDRLKSALLFFLFGWQLFSGLTLFGQYKGFNWPIDSPFVITGTYGELRPNHFHAGLDFATNGKTDLPVYAAADGYVSRIRLNSVGYGKCLYVTHPNGYVTVYGHLNSFSLKIEKIVDKYLYSEKKYEIDYQPEPHAIPVKKNEIIAVSGNTGGSTGPHLHFEIREEKSEVPVNPLDFFSIPDKISPFVKAFRIYDLSDSLDPITVSIQRTRAVNKDSVVIGSGQLIVDKPVIGFAFSGVDQMVSNGNSGNIYKVRCFVDEKLFYAHTLRSVSFDDGRYVNELSDARNRMIFQKCFLPTFYPARFCDAVEDKGRVTLDDTLFHRFRFDFYDEADNRISCYLNVKARHPKVQAVSHPEMVDCRNSTTIKNNACLLYIPPAALYQNADIKINGDPGTGGGLILSPTDINLSKAVTVSFPLPEKFAQVRSQLVLQNKNIVLPGNIKNDSIFFQLKDFGSYVLRVDSTPPEIKLLPKSPSKNGVPSVSFQLKDKLSGISSYVLYLNDNWVWAYYDAKVNQLNYEFRPDDPSGLLRFRVEGTDRVGNRRTAYFLLKK